MPVFITNTGRFLPGDPVDNRDIEKFIGRLWGESKVKKQILAANRITQRYYAQDLKQRPTHDVYEMAAAAIQDCLQTDGDGEPISYLSAGSTNTPYVGPGLASLLHGRLSKEGILQHPVEINSNSGICSSAAQALVNSYRAVSLGEHAKAVCVGAEHPSQIIKTSVLRPKYDLVRMLRDVKTSEWFRTVFLRFMLSDGAGAFLLRNKRPAKGICYEVNWTFSQSFANEAPLCMKLDSKTLLLSQDIAVLSKHLGPCVRQFVHNAMSHYGDSLANYDRVLPHISSYYFIRELKSVMRESGAKPEFWTNLSTMGNTGAASIFILLDDYTRTQNPTIGSKILLFVPESGQFNFVIVSLTVV